MVITRLAMNIASKPGIKNLDHVVAEMGKHIEGIDRARLVESINEASGGTVRAKSELVDMVGKIRREAKTDLSLRKATAALESHLKSGTLPEKAVRGRAEPTEAIADLKTKKDAVLSALRQSDPAIRKKYEAQIVNLTDRLEHGTFDIPAPKTRPPLSREAERLEFQVDKLKGEIRQRIRDARPRSVFSKGVGGLNDLTRVMLGGDLGMVLRQGGPLTIANPERVPAAARDLVRAFKSEESAFKARQEIDARENAPKYAAANLQFTDSSGLGKREEGFLGRVVGKVPGFSHLERAQVAYLNRLRADVFDSMERSWGQDGVFTHDQAKAIADYINTATGRADLGRFEPAAEALNTAFLAPKLAISRFQLVAGKPLWKGDTVTRKAIAAQYGRYLTGAAAIYGLGVAGGGEVQPDGKLKFGKTTLDPLSGLTQVTTLVGKFGKAAAENLGGVEFPKVRGQTAGDQALTAGKNYLSYKLSPTIGLARELVSGKNAINQKVTPGESVMSHLIPLSGQDIANAIEAEGVERGTALGIASLLGASINTREEKRERRD